MSNTKSLLKGVAALGFLAALTSTSYAEGFAAGDVAVGEKVFKKCIACHAVGEGAKNKVGPILTNVVGSAAGSVEGYKYGKSLAVAGEAGLVWSEEEIFAYLKNPKKYLRAKLDDKKAKSKMSFRLKKDKDRNNVIAYLKSLGTSN